MKKLIFIAILIFPFFSFSQTEEDTTAYTAVEKMPEFPGGEEKLYEYLGKNIKFPNCYIELGLFKRQFFQFIIEKDGSITNIKVIKNENKTNCKSNAIDVIKNMPKWTPGEQRGKKVRVKYILPISFHPR